MLLWLRLVPLLLVVPPGLALSLGSGHGGPCRQLAAPPRTGRHCTGQLSTTEALQASMMFSFAHL